MKPSEVTSDFKNIAELEALKAGYDNGKTPKVSWVNGIDNKVEALTWMLDELYERMKLEVVRNGSKYEVKSIE